MHGRSILSLGLGLIMSTAGALGAQPQYTITEVSIQVGDLIVGQDGCSVASCNRLVASWPMGQACLTSGTALAWTSARTHVTVAAGNTMDMRSSGGHDGR